MRLPVGEGKTAETNEEARRAEALRCNQLPVKLSAPTTALITAGELRR